MDAHYWNILNWDKKLELELLGKKGRMSQEYFILLYREVLKAKHLTTGKVVALKKIFTKSEQEGFPITSLREIKLLKMVSHPNVSGLIDMAVSYKNNSETDSKEIEDILMVFPFMDHDLTGILENSNIKLTLPQIKCYMKQLLEGISYLHSVKHECISMI